MSYFDKLPDEMIEIILEKLYKDSPYCIKMICHTYKKLTPIAIRVVERLNSQGIYDDEWVMFALVYPDCFDPNFYEYVSEEEDLKNWALTKLSP